MQQRSDLCYYITNTRFLTFVCASFFCWFETITEWLGRLPKVNPDVVFFPMFVCTTDPYNRCLKSKSFFVKLNPYPPRGGVGGSPILCT